LFFFHVPPPPDIYPLSLHDALPISGSMRWASWTPPGRGASLTSRSAPSRPRARDGGFGLEARGAAVGRSGDVMPCTTSKTSAGRSEEHTSELQSRENLVCRLLLEKK